MPQQVSWAVKICTALITGGKQKVFLSETTDTGWPIGVVPPDFVGARAIVVPL